MNTAASAMGPGLGWGLYCKAGESPWGWLNPSWEYIGQCSRDNGFDDLVGDWSCFEQGVGLDDLLRSLPTLIFDDSMIRVFFFCPLSLVCPCRTTSYHSLGWVVSIAVKPWAGSTKGLRWFFFLVAVSSGSDRLETTNRLVPGIPRTQDSSPSN
ncbi:unnamed protein product [Eretmochelys imbricata]